MPSILPNSIISSFAVFSPIPFTPGMLSAESPISPSISTTFSGGTPNFSITFCTSMISTSDTLLPYKFLTGL